jgi:hypothetical protein
LDYAGRDRAFVMGHAKLNASSPVYGMG